MFQVKVTEKNDRFRLSPSKIENKIIFVKVCGISKYNKDLKVQVEPYIKDENSQQFLEMFDDVKKQCETILDNKNVEYTSYHPVHNNTFKIKIPNNITLQTIGPKGKILDKNPIESYFGNGSVISFNANINSYLINDKLYPLCLKATDIYFAKVVPNTTTLQSSYTKEEMKKYDNENYYMSIPDGYTPSSTITISNDFPIIPLESFEPEKLTFSKVKERDGKKAIYMNYNGNREQVKISIKNVTTRRSIEADKEYNSRKLIIPLSYIFTSIIENTDTNFVNHLSTYSKDIWGEKFTTESIRDMVKHLCYADSDEEHRNPRLNIKVRKDENDITNTRLFVLNNETKEIEKVDIEDCSSLEPYIKAGTQIDEMVVNMSISIVNENVHPTFSLEQIRLDPSKPKVQYTTLNGFPYSGFEHLNLQKCNKQCIPFSKVKDIHFGECKDNKFDITFGDNETKHVILETMKNIYKVGIENDPENQKYPFTLKFFPPENMSFFDNVDTELRKYCKKNMKKLLGKKISDDVFERKMFNNGTIKTSKKDDSKYISAKFRVYEEFMNIEVYQCVPAFSGDKHQIKKIEFSSIEELPTIFHRNAYIKPVVSFKGSNVNNNPRISIIIHSVLYYGTELPSGNVVDIPFDFSEMSKDIEDIKEESKQETMEKVPEPTTNTNDISESDDDSEEEEESDDE